MNELVNGKCEVCRVGAPEAGPEEIKLYSGAVPEWAIPEEEDVRKLTRRFETESYEETVRLFNAIAELAEQEGHHPVMLAGFREITVWWWTHKIKGLHKNDFIMAAKTDALYAREFGEKA